MQPADRGHRHEADGAGAARRLAQEAERDPADRADGIHLRNFTVQFSDFNNVYVLETNGFRMENIISRWSREYGFLSFTSDNGLYR